MKACTSAGRTAALAGFCLCLVGAPARSEDRLSIRVSPAVSLAPGFLTIRAVVQADTDNRALEVIAESNDFYTSSQLQLNGANSPRIREVRFAGLPEGAYQVTAILVGTQGQRAVATQSILVGMPAESR